MFNSLSDRLTATFKNLRTKGRLSESDVNKTVRDIRLALLDADVALPVVKEFTSAVRERALGAEVSGALNPAQQVVKIVNDELVSILGGETRKLRLAKNPPTVIMLAGLQGSGKTTLAGKLGKFLKDQGQTPLLVAADLQRPNAVTQLEVVGQRAGVPVFAPERGNIAGHDAVTGAIEGTRSFGDPVAVAEAGIQEACNKLYSVVIVDTAGRLAVDENLMQQAADIRAAIQPDEVLFVIDAMIGQAAVDTAEAFLHGVDFTGVVLSKLDGDARGGIADQGAVQGEAALVTRGGEDAAVMPGEEVVAVAENDRIAVALRGEVVEQARQGRQGRGDARTAAPGAATIARRVDAGHTGGYQHGPGENKAGAQDLTRRRALSRERTRQHRRARSPDIGGGYFINYLKLINFLLSWRQRGRPGVTSIAA